MKREPPFKPDPTQPGEYIINLAGSVLLAGDAAYGNPADTTPEGQAVAHALIERFLKVATAHGFKQADILHALLRRNQPAARLVNLTIDAMNCIPKQLRIPIIEETFGTKGMPTEQAFAPDYPADATRPGPDGVDPRFWAAGHELQRIATEEGADAIHKPEHAHLYSQMLRFAPEPLKSEMRAKAREMGLLPKVTHVGEDGQAVFSAEQLAQTHGVSVGEVERFIEQAGIEPGDFYTGPVHPLQ